MQTVTVGPLEATLVPSGSSTAHARDVVLLHGFGAPGTDLVGLERGLELEVPTRFIYLQAPHTLPGMTGPMAGRAWWHIDMMALHLARMGREYEQLAAQVPEGIEEARSDLQAAMDALVAHHGLDLTKTVIGGFSQGAMLSCDWVLRSGAPVQALVQLSGTVICEKDWQELLTRHPGRPVFQSHSPDDQVLPFELAERHRDNLTRAGWPVEFVSFRGGHGIAPPVFAEFSRFFSAL